VDIAAHLGSNVGYVGFGGGTGGETAVQDVLTWTYHSAGLHEHGDGDSSAAGTFGPATTASVSALLVGAPSASGSFLVDTALPLASPTESGAAVQSAVLDVNGSLGSSTRLAGSPEISLPISAGALAGGGTPSSSAPLIGDAGSGSGNDLTLSMAAIDQVLNSQELFDVL
jgi:hypothetical protein